MEHVSRGNRMYLKFLIIYFLLFLIWVNPNITWATTYHCETIEKYDFGIVYSKEQIDKWNYSVRVEELANETNVYRCSFSIINDEVTMRNKISIVIAGMVLAGCAGSTIATRADLSNSKAAYKNCLKQTPGKCATEKELYLIDIEAVKAVNSGVLLIE